MINILFTSVGRRAYLVDFFKEALSEIGGKIHVSNSVEYTSASKVADAFFISPAIYDEQYISTVLNYCEEHQISIVIPLFDIDLLVLAKNKKAFDEKGVLLLVSNPETIETCNDKWLTYQFLCSIGLKTPKTFIDKEEVLIQLNKKELEFPLYIKPRWGMGSIAVQKVSNLKELSFFYDFIQKEIYETYLKFESEYTKGSEVLIQEMIDGQEYGLDVVNNIHGEYQTTYPKEKIAMRSGETDIAKLVDDQELHLIGEKISTHLKHIGNLDIDVFKYNNEYYILEMNARFGGGYPFSHLAGANLPLAIVKWSQGEQYKLNTKLDYGTIFYKKIEII